MIFVPSMVTSATSTMPARVAQREHLIEELGDCLVMALANAGDGRVVWGLVGGEDAVGDVFE